MDKNDSLTGSSVQIDVSDPWEFRSENGFSSFDGSIVLAQANSLLVTSSSNVVFGGKKYNTFVCSARYAGQDIKTLKKDGKLTCNVIAIPPDRVGSSDPLDVSWWRGKAAAIATLTTC